MVMPFELCDASAVFQRFIQNVLQGLNPPEGPDFMFVYVNDVLVLLKTLEEHLTHLQGIIQYIQESGVKLNPSKCHFTRREVDYLGHIITHDGVNPKLKLVVAPH